MGMSDAVAYLVPTTGPAIEPLRLEGVEKTLLLGRHEACDLRLPPDAEQVSRQHARLTQVDGIWRLADNGSRWGTFVNGVKLSQQVDVTLREGDLIGIAPWTFAFSRTARRRGLQARDDLGQTMVRAVTEKQLRPMQESLLHLLLEVAEQIHSASTEKELADQILNAAIRGSGLANGVVLQPVDEQSFEVISTHLSPAAQNSPAVYSRSLIQAASGGQVAEISASSLDQMSQSMVQMKVSAAMCVPLMLGGSPAAYLYLDSRGSVMQTLQPNAQAFCVALSRIGSLALANLKRMEMEARQARMDAEMNSAAAAQKWIMPQRVKQFGDIETLGESQPGQFVGGDFFDLIPLSNGRLGIAVADVSGKGVTASVLMTATQGFLHAALEQFGEPGAAVTALNRFIVPRRPAHRFVTLWVGVIDTASGTIRYVDAAHSYAVLRHADGRTEQLCDGGGPPLGVMEDSEYIASEVRFQKGDSLTVVSDGIIEQPAGASIERLQFEVEGLCDVLKSHGPDPVTEIFHKLREHAGTDHFADDATVVYARWK